MAQAVQFGLMDVQATQAPLTSSKPDGQLVQPFWLHCEQFGVTEEQVWQSPSLSRYPVSHFRQVTFVPTRTSQARPLPAAADGVGGSTSRG